MLLTFRIGCRKFMQEISMAKEENVSRALLHVCSCTSAFKGGILTSNVVKFIKEKILLECGIGSPNPVPGKVGVKFRYHY